MSTLISLLNAVSWPIVALILGFLAAFGGLNRPLEAMTKSFGSIFKEVRDFRRELEKLEEKLAEIPASFSVSIVGMKDDVKEIESSLSTKLTEIERQIQTVRERVTQEALAEETGIEPSEIQSNSLAEPDAKEAIRIISESWAAVREKLEAKFPEAKSFDKREYGRAIQELSQKETYQKLSNDLAKSVASLHSRFKGFTRRKAYADEWLTQEIRDSYLRDVQQVQSKLDSI